MSENDPHPRRPPDATLDPAKPNPFAAQLAITGSAQREPARQTLRRQANRLRTHAAELNRRAYELDALADALPDLPLAADNALLDLATSHR